MEGATATMSGQEVWIQIKKKQVSETRYKKFKKIISLMMED
ncbi:hypothetical protein [Photobacterium kishitanii]|nr:hypothetical protein [Photobacterium kishitanii]